MLGAKKIVPLLQPSYPLCNWHGHAVLNTWIRSVQVEMLLGSHLSKNSDVAGIEIFEANLPEGFCVDGIDPEFVGVPRCVGALVDEEHGMWFIIEVGGNSLTGAPCIQLLVHSSSVDLSMIRN